MLAPKSVCAVIPTRGDVPMADIVRHLYSYPEIAEVKVMVGDTIFNRYLGALEAKQEVIYTQDDDCITDIRPILQAYDPRLIVNAMTKRHAKQYRRRQTLLGFGSLFHRSLLQNLMDPKWIRDELFYSKCDRIFSTVNEHKTVFPKITLLPYSTADNRLYRQPDHGAKVTAMNERILAVTGIKA